MGRNHQHARGPLRRSLWDQERPGHNRALSLQDAEPAQCGQGAWAPGRASTSQTVSERRRSRSHSRTPSRHSAAKAPGRRAGLRPPRPCQREGETHGFTDVAFPGQTDRRRGGRHTYLTLRELSPSDLQRESRHSECGLRCRDPHKRMDMGPGAPPPRTPSPAPGPPLSTLGLLAQPGHAPHFDWNCFCRTWGPTLELGGGLWFQNSVRLQPRRLNQRTRVGTAPASRPLLAVHGVSPHSRLYSQVPRNQFHCVTEETSLNVEKPDN